MGFIKDIFEGAANSNVLQQGDSNIIYCDCGNTLFGDRFEGGLNKPLFHFLVALKKDGYDVRLISDETKKYTPRVKEYLRKLGLKDRFFQGEDGLTITIKGAMGDDDALVVIDNNHRSHNIRAGRYINPHSEDFIKDLAQFAKPHKGLPASLSCKMVLAT
jgi:hypothetical protein